VMAAGVMADGPGAFGPGGSLGPGGSFGSFGPGGSFGPAGPGALGPAGPGAFGPAGPGAFGFGEGFGAFGGYWAFRALGAGMNGRGPWPQATRSAERPMAVRPDVTRGRLTPATEDLSALAVTGESPTVLAFVLAQGPGGVAYEVLNRPEPVTYVFRGELAAVNRALDGAGFDPAGLAHLLVPGGQVPHDEQWPDRIAALLAG
jgi:hypothetical protein